MIELEAELMLLGIWRNIDEMEDNLSIQELRLMLDAKREQEYRLMKFQAALQGVKLGEDKKEENPVERIKRKVRARQQGVDEEKLRFTENMNTMGFRVREE